MYGFAFATQEWESLLPHLQDPDCRRFTWGRLSPPPRRANAQQHAVPLHSVIQPFSLVLWCFHPLDTQHDQGRPPCPGLGGPSAYAVFWGSTVASLEVLNWLMWLFPDCCSVTLHGRGLQRSSNLSAYLLKADGELFPETSRNEEITGKEGVGGTEMDWKRFWSGSC